MLPDAFRRGEKLYFTAAHIGNSPVITLAEKRFRLLIFVRPAELDVLLFFKHLFLPLF
jgi:hypothetical protein